MAAAWTGRPSDWTGGLLCPVVRHLGSRRELLRPGGHDIRAIPSGRPPMQKIDFSSDSLPSHLTGMERFRLWRDMWNEQLGPAEIRHPQDKPFVTTTTALLLGDVRVGRFDTTADYCVRTRKHVAVARDDILVGFYRGAVPQLLSVGNCGLSLDAAPASPTIWRSHARAGTKAPRGGRKSPFRATSSSSSCPMPTNARRGCSIRRTPRCGTSGARSTFCSAPTR